MDTGVYLKQEINLQIGWLLEKFWSSFRIGEIFVPIYNTGLFFTVKECD